MTTTDKAKTLASFKADVLKSNDNQLAIRKEIKRIIEALLFSYSEPISLKKLRAVINTTYPYDNQQLLTLIKEFSRRI